MRNSDYSDEAKSKLTAIFPNAAFQHDLKDQNLQNKARLIVSVFDYCIDFFRKYATYPNHETNEFFSNLWNKIANKDGIHVAFDSNSKLQRILVGVIQKKI